jgi:hypothetical protein
LSLLIAAVVFLGVVGSVAALPVGQTLIIP